MSHCTRWPKPSSKYAWAPCGEQNMTCGDSPGVAASSRPSGAWYWATCEGSTGRRWGRRPRSDNAQHLAQRGAKTIVAVGVEHGPAKTSARREVMRRRGREPSVDGVGQRGKIVGLHQATDAPAEHRVHRAVLVAGHDRRPTGHRLQEDDAEALLGRRHHEQVAVAVQPRQVGIGNEAQEAHEPVLAGLRHETLETLAVLPVPP